MSENLSFIIEDKNKKFLLSDWCKKKIKIFAGLILLCLLFSIILSLATWDVYDPSFSYITLRLPKNFLGYGGSIFSDIVMQCFGIAIVFCLPPPTVWAFSLLFDKKIYLFSQRFTAWLINFLVSATFFSSLPISNSWPIQNGFGGIIGDIIIRLPALFFEGYPRELGFLLFQLVLFLAMILLLFFSSGTILNSKPNDRHNNSDYSINFDQQNENQTDVINPSILKHTWNRLNYWISVFFRFGFLSFLIKKYSRNSSISMSDNFEKIEPTLDLGFSKVMDSESKIRIQEDQKLDTDVVRNIPELNMTNYGSGNFDLPSTKILFTSQSCKNKTNFSTELMQDNACILKSVLSDFGIQGEIVNIRPGPVVTLYELEPAPGIKSSRIIGLSDDIARSMSAISARVAVIPGRNAIGIELPNDTRETVILSDLIVSNVFETNKCDLAINLGKSIEGKPVVADLAKMPHLLIAGTTGSGKSVAINTMILSLLYRMTPDQCRLIMIDPKMLELSVYDGIPNLLTPVVTDPKKAVTTLKWLVCEMEERYQKMSKIGVRNIDGFNLKIARYRNAGKDFNRTVQTGFDRKTGEAIYETEYFDLQHMPYIVVVIDEMADLMMVARKDIECAVQRLAQMARASGIHVIMATQRPSVDVITGTIKANFPTRISFQVSSKIDSRTILGEQGAEQLLGQGDMLYMTGGGRVQRIHGPFVSDIEVERVVSHLKKQGEANYIDIKETMVLKQGIGMSENSSCTDDLYKQAVDIVLRDNKASISYIQRRLGIGYNRAASIIESMEEKGVIGPASSTGKREILLSYMEEC
ncbi:FtsK/SpoIIIE family DNA translocase [Candidatus Liberibacter brunswickensis]|uniref:FtsK/SpoIIIE family DNA translocase n=1 Tax=Candidatus Liberibacter brunswickensis TaxID=1968796 RepID=UPI002FDFBAD6